MSEDATPAADARLHQAEWLSLDELMQNAYRHWRRNPFPSGQEVFEQSLRAQFEDVHKLGVGIGGKMEFQDLDPEGSPGMSARFRLTLADGERVVFDGDKGLLDWMVERRPQLRAMALRHHLAGLTEPATTAAAPSLRRRAL